MTNRDYLEALLYKYEQARKKSEQTYSYSGDLLERTRQKAVYDALTMVLDDLTCTPCLTKDKKTQQMEAAQES